MTEFINADFLYLVLVLKPRF